MKKRKEKKKPKSIYDQIRKPTPKGGYAFKDRKRLLRDEELRKEMDDY